MSSPPEPSATGAAAVGGGPVHGAAQGVRGGWRSALWIFVFAVGVRLAALAILPLHAPEDGPRGPAWEWGAETACLAEALYEGRGLADPWARDSGPSSWLTPVYPALVAGCMFLTGGLDASTAILLFALQAFLSAWTCVGIVRLGALLGLSQAGRFAGLVFALYPLAVWHSIRTVWDTTAAACALTWFLVLACGLRRPAGARSSALLGLAYGGLLFLNPAPLAIAPAVLLFVALRSEGWRTALARAAVFTLAAAAVQLPWMVRNQAVLGTWKVRPNFGVELMIGNHDEAHGHPVPFQYHPSHVDRELERYLELGEAAYSSECTDRAVAWVRAHPRRFLELSLHRARLYWLGNPPFADPRTKAGVGASGDPLSWIKFLSYLAAGLGGLLGVLLVPLRRDVRWLLAGALVLVGAPYFLTHVSERYRFAVDPLLVLLGTALLLHWVVGRRKRAEDPLPVG